MSWATREAGRAARRQDELRAISGFVREIGDAFDQPGGLQTEDLMRIELILDKAGYRLRRRGYKTPVVLSIEEEFKRGLLAGSADVAVSMPSQGLRTCDKTLQVEIAIDDDNARAHRFVDPECAYYSPGSFRVSGPDHEGEIRRLCGAIGAEIRVGRPFYGWADFWQLVEEIARQRDEIWSDVQKTMRRVAPAEKPKEVEEAAP